MEAAAVVSYVGSDLGVDDMGTREGVVVDERPLDDWLMALM